MKRASMWVAYNKFGEITDYFKEEDSGEAFYTLYTNHLGTVILRSATVYIEDTETLAAQMLASRFKEWGHYMSKDDLINNINYTDLYLPAMATFANSKGDYETVKEAIRYKENAEKRYEETMKRICE